MSRDILQLLTPDQAETVKTLLMGDTATPTRQYPDETVLHVGAYIFPKYDPVQLADVPNKSSRLMRAIRAKARNTVGLGYDIVPDARLEHDMAPADYETFRHEADDLYGLFDQLNAEQDLSEVLESWSIDEEVTGDGWIEFVQDRAGVIRRGYHAPSRSMRISTRISTAGNRLLLQIRAGMARIRYFRPFGDPTTVNPETGEPNPALPWNLRASQMIHTRVYVPDDDWYGAPRWIACLPGILSTRLGQEWNLAYIRNAANTPFAAILEGGSLSAESRQTISGMLDREAKGARNAGRAILLEPELSGGSPALAATTKIRIEKIGIGTQEDGSFLKLRSVEVEEVREAMGIPLMLLGTFTDANKSNAVIALRVAVQQEFEPEIQRIEGRLNRTVVRARGARFARLRLRRPKILDPLQDASVVQKLMTAYTLNELRQIAADLRGERYYPSDTPLADVPMGFFRNPQDLEVVEHIVGQITDAVQDRTARGAEVYKVNGDGGTLLPPEFDRVVPFRRKETP